MAFDPTLTSARRLGSVVTVGPVGHPLALADAKAHLRIDAADTWEEDSIEALCAAVHRKLESDLGFPILRQTRRTVLDAFPSSATPAIWLGGGDSPAIEAIEYLDTAGDAQTMAEADYVLDEWSAPARVLPASTWPACSAQPGAVKIDWTAGWETAADVPEDLMHAQKLLLGHWHENREAVVLGTISSTVQLGWGALLEPYRLIGLA